jgi:hypothetical protein
MVFRSIPDGTSVAVHWGSIAHRGRGRGGWREDRRAVGARSGAWLALIMGGGVTGARSLCEGLPAIAPRAWGRAPIVCLVCLSVSSGFGLVFACLYRGRGWVGFPSLTQPAATLVDLEYRRYYTPHQITRLHCSLPRLPWVYQSGHVYPGEGCRRPIPSTRELSGAVQAGDAPSNKHHRPSNTAIAVKASAGDR